MSDWWDPLARWRYGVGASDKYALAVRGAIPGAQPISSEEDVRREERRAAAFLFALQHPRLADLGVGLANTIRFWEPDSIHAAANEGLTAARGAGVTLGDLLASAQRGAGR